MPFVWPWLLIWHFFCKFKLIDVILWYLLQGHSAGLLNLGNTCYMNSTVQCLHLVPELKSALIKWVVSFPGGKKAKAKRNYTTVFSICVNYCFAINLCVSGIPLLLEATMWIRLLIHLLLQHANFSMILIEVSSQWHQCNFWLYWHFFSVSLFCLNFWVKFTANICSWW